MNTAMRAVLVAVAVLVVGLAAADSAEAVKHSRRPVARGVATQRTFCEEGGGTLTAETYTTVAYTSCSGGKSDGYTCTITPSSTDCAWKRVVPGGDGPLGDVLGGGIVEVIEVSDDPVGGQGPTVVETAGVADEVADEPAAAVVPLPGGIAEHPAVEGAPAATEAEDAADGA